MIDDAIVLNALEPYSNPQKRRYAATTFKSRCGPEARDLVDSETDPEKILQILEDRYNPVDSGRYSDLLRELHSITMGTMSVTDYTKAWRDVKAKIDRMGKENSIAEPHLIHLYLFNLSPAFDTFLATYLQTHTVIGVGRISFDQVANATRLEERRLASSEERITLFAGRGQSSKGPPLKNGQPTGEKTPLCGFCKQQGRNLHHKKDDCWFKFPNKKPVHLLKPEEKKRRADDLYQSAGNTDASKRRRIDNVPHRAEADDDHYMNYANYAADQPQEEEELSIRGYHSRSPHVNMAAMAFALEETRAAEAPAKSGSNMVDRLKNLIFIDSGCSQHVFSQDRHFVSKRPYHGRPIKGIGDTSIRPSFVGSIKFPAHVGSRVISIRIDDVLYAPEVGVNLLSVGQMADDNVRIGYDRSGWTMTRGKFSATGPRWHGLYVIDLASMGRPLADAAFHAYTLPDSKIQQLWHSRLGHPGRQALSKIPQITNGVDYSKTPAQAVTCEHCLQARIKAQPHTGTLRRGTRPMEYIHTDIVGKIATGFDGLNYFVTFKYSFTRYAEGYTIRRKANVFDRFIFFQKYNTFPGQEIKFLYMDNLGISSCLSILGTKISAYFLWLFACFHLGSLCTL